MIAATREEQKTAKLKFFAVYLASVALIIIMLASVWRTDATASTHVPVTYSAGAVAKADEVLHAKLEALDNLYARAFASNGLMDTVNLTLAKTNFKNTVDSLEKVAAAVNDVNEKAELTTLLSRFRNAVEARSGALIRYAILAADSTRPVIVQDASSANDAALEELKAILMQKEERIATLEKGGQASADAQARLEAKDKEIAALRNQLSQRPSTPVQTVATGGDGEWKQKYTALKSTHDKVVAENSTLNKSYKTLVDDNRRLLSQLQSARKQ